MMECNPFENMGLSGLIPHNILKKEGEFTILGLKISHNGRGRVVITGSNGKLYSDAYYHSPSEVEGIINNIVETKIYGSGRKK